MKSLDLRRATARGQKWTMMTAYDHPTAELVDEAGIDFALVGDSLGMVVLGYPSTAPVTMDEMLHHAKAVRRGLKKAWLLGDLPLKGVERGPAQAVASARRFLKEAGCDGVKLEWRHDAPAILKALIRAGIPVMGHVGLTPQTARRFRVTGADAKAAAAVLAQARAFERGGAFAVLLECVPAPVAAAATAAIDIPTVGIGAGPDCDGQVLVFHDLVGLFAKFTPKFVRRYADLRPQALEALRAFARDVRAGDFPESRHTYGMPDEELQRFLAYGAPAKGRG